MQRSRRAFLQRRAFEKDTGGIRDGLYKLSLSLVLLLWGFLFLSSLWISQGDGYRDGLAVNTQDVGVSSWIAEKLGNGENSDSVHKRHVEEFGSHSDEILSVDVAVKKDLSEDLLVDGFGLQHLEATIGGRSEDTSPKNDRPSRIAPLGLDEFKSRAFSSKTKTGTGSAGGVVHRMEPGGKEYNYASSSKGAKVLGFNKEAKGASNILMRDKDKYLRNPCSAEEKYVILELSEETLVDTIEIANFEHYSSNLKDFELLGSLVYPTAQWVKLGNFTTANVKQARRFVLSEPKWVRYLRLNLLTHYGSEFYCTLSLFEVYGVDAVEKMLEDLVSVQDKVFVPEEKKPFASQLAASEGDDGDQLDSFKEIESELSVENSSNLKSEVQRNELADPVEEIHYHHSGRSSGDSALKVLMQKARSLDLSLSLLERYVEEVNSRHGNIFKDLDKDIADNTLLLEKMRLEMKNLHASQKLIVEEVDDLKSWKSLVSRKMDDIMRDNHDLRSKVGKVQDNQVSMEQKGIVVFSVCLIFGFVALLRVVVDMVQWMCMVLVENPRKFCRLRYSWLVLLLNCSIIILILSL
ncbi:SUN domain-containing protein 4 [Linum perenne]